jgi:hypothetical protein
MIGVVLAAGLVGLPIWLGNGLIAGSILAALAVGAMLALLLPAIGWQRALLLPGLAILVFAAAFSAILPRLDPLWVSREAAQSIARHLPAGAPIVSTAGYSEPSIVVLLGTQTRLGSAVSAATDLAEQRSAAALVSDRDEAAFRDALAAHHVAAHPVDRVEGFNYSRGRRVVLTLYLPG